MGMWTIFFVSRKMHMKKVKMKMVTHGPQMYHPFNVKIKLFWSYAIFTKCQEQGFRK